MSLEIWKLVRARGKHNTKFILNTRVNTEIAQKLVEPELLNYDQNLSRRVKVQYLYIWRVTTPLWHGFDDLHTQLMKRALANIS